GWNGFSMSDEDASRRRRQTFKPANNFFPISMSGKAANLFDLAPYRNPLAQYLHLFLAISDATPQRARGLITNKNYSGSFVRKQTQCVMEYTPASHHSRRGDDHARPFGILQAFRILPRAARQPGGRAHS